MAAIDLNDLLIKTSRTFALAIPLLPEPTRREVGIAYLLFRIADTFEDATEWPQAERIAALNEFAALLEKHDLAGLRAATKKWLAKPPSTNDGYMELLAKTPEVVDELSTMTPGAQKILRLHAARTARGMAEVVSKGDAKGNLKLHSVEELQGYCYIVAGIVGELLTDIFLNDAPALNETPQALTLKKHTIAFGEGLQLVNILKDSNDDAVDGRVYLPTSVPKSDIFRLARKNLDAATEYVDALQQAKAPRGFIAFCALPVMLARKALNATEKSGAGAKVGRTEVMLMFARLQGDLDAGKSLRAACG